jgi:hypothetical protein
VTQQTAGQVTSPTFVETMWSKFEKELEVTDEQMKAITNYQIMVQAPSHL